MTHPYRAGLAQRVVIQPASRRELVEEAAERADRAYARMLHRAQRFAQWADEVAADAQDNPPAVLRSWRQAAAEYQGAHARFLEAKKPGAK